MKTWLIVTLLLFAYDSFAARTPLDIIDENWLQLKTENFHIITDLEQKYAQNFAEDLEQFRFYSLQFSKIKMKEEIPPLKVFALSNSATYKVFKLPKHSLGIFLNRPSGNYAIANMSGYRSGTKKQNIAQQVLRHEYVHFMFDNGVSDAVIPRWYNEGMAEYLSTLRMVDGYLHFGEINLSRLATVDKNKKVDIESLLKADRIPESRIGGNDYYAHALTLVHYCNFHPGMQEKLLKYLQLVNQGRTVDAAFSNAFAMDYESLGDKIRKYLKKRKFQSRRIEQKEPDTVKKVEISSLSTETLAFYLGELMMVTGLAEEGASTAIVLLENSLQSKRVEKGQAMHHMFAIQLVQKNIDAAETVLQRMELEVEDYPGTYTAQADLSVLKMNALLKGDDPAWRDYFKLARGKYREAIALDKTFIPGYIGLTSIYSNNIDGDLNLSEGVNAFAEVSKRLNNPNLDYQHAVLLLRYRRPRQARDLLTRVIAGTPDEELANKARKLKFEIFIENSEGR